MSSPDIDTSDALFRSVVSDLSTRWGTREFWRNPQSVPISLKALFYAHGLIESPELAECRASILEAMVRQLIRRQEYMSVLHVLEKGVRYE